MKRSLLIQCVATLALVFTACVETTPDDSPAEAASEQALSLAVEDVDHGRVVFVTGNPDDTFVLTRAVTCVSETGVVAPTLTEAGASCDAAAKQDVRYYYQPLQRDLADASDADILAAPAVELAPAVDGASRPCGQHGPEFQGMVDKLAADLGDGTLAHSDSRVAVLISHADASAIGWVPSDRLPGGMQAAAQMAPGATCVCAHGGSGGCTVVSGPGGTQTCASESCTTCTLSSGGGAAFE